MEAVAQVDLSDVPYIPLCPTALWTNRTINSPMIWKRLIIPTVSHEPVIKISFFPEFEILA
jgi:hypothetical protein